MKQLLTNPTTADVDDFLKSHNISKGKALKILLYRPDASDENSSIMICKTSIRPKELSEEDMQAGKTPKDNFNIKYLLPREGYRNKMRRAFIREVENTPNAIQEDINYYERPLSSAANSLGVISQCIPGTTGDRFASYVNGNTKNYKPSIFADEEQMKQDILAMDRDNAYKNRGGIKIEEDGATSCGSCLQSGSAFSDGTQMSDGANPNAGEYTAPFGKKVIKKGIYMPDMLKEGKRKKIQITQEQFDYLMEATAGDIGTGGQTGIAYPFSVKADDPSMDHKNIMKKSFPNG